MGDDEHGYQKIRACQSTNCRGISYLLSENIEVSSLICLVVNVYHCAMRQDMIQYAVFSPLEWGGREGGRGLSCASF